MKKTNSSKPRKVRETKAEYRVRAEKESRMNLIEQIQKRLLKLSTDKQREVLDFVAFLQLRSSKPSALVTEVKQIKLSEFFRVSPLAGVDLTRDKSLVHLPIRGIKAKTNKKKSALKVIESLKVDALADWSENIETYL